MLLLPSRIVHYCRYPAACGGAPGIGAYLTSAASACIAKMLFAAGLPEDVNASWYGGGSGSGGFNTGGPGFMYGGMNQYGMPVGQGIYDMHASGFGAAPDRDGVASGGHMNNPTVGISDVENIEMQYPLLYLSRNHMTDSGGFGKFRGGLGLQRIILSRGSSNLTVNYSPYHGIPSGWGLFGGYPAGIGGDKFRLDPADLAKEFARSRYPVSLVDAASWGKVDAPDLPPLRRMAVPEGCILVDPVTVGSGYGDPLDRDPARVLTDMLDYAVSQDFALKIYGVVLDKRGQAVDEPATTGLRADMRRQRLKRAKPVPGGAAGRGRKAVGRKLLRIHEYLDIVQQRGSLRVACRKCDHDLGAAEQNYKLACVHAEIDKDALTGLPPPGGRHSIGSYVEYYCPGCGTLLDVETRCPSVEGEKIEPIWDIALAPAALKRARDSLHEEEAA